MKDLRRFRRRPRRLQPTDASRALLTARQRARLQVQQLATALGVHPRSVTRWELGEAHPSKAQWTKVVACLAQYVPREAVELAAAAGVPSPIVEPPPPDARAIEDAILRVADLLDVSPRRARLAVRELVKATTEAHGRLADLGRAAEEKIPEPSATRAAQEP